MDALPMAITGSSLSKSTGMVKDKVKGIGIGIGSKSNGKANGANHISRRYVQALYLRYLAFINWPCDGII